MLKAYIFLIVTYGCDYCMATIIKKFKKIEYFSVLYPKTKNIFKTEEVIFVSHLSELNLHSAEIGTNIMFLVMTLQVAGLHRVRPSTTLDKSFDILFFSVSTESRSLHSPYLFNHN